MSRNGKIARLPRTVRDDLNRRLQNGGQGEPLLEWLNALPETQTLLQEQFAGVAISKQNLSEWRQGGFVEWEFKADYLLDSRETRAEAEEIGTATDGRLADNLAAVLTARYASLVQTWNGEVTAEFQTKLKVLQGMIQNVSHLRRWDHNATKVRMDQELHEARREKSEEEIIEQFERWIKRPEVHDWICQTWKTPVEREQEKRRLLGRWPLTKAEIARMEGKPPEGGSSKDQHPTSREIPSAKLQNERKVGQASCLSGEPAERAVNPGQTTLDPHAPASASTPNTPETPHAKPAASPFARKKARRPAPPKSKSVKPSQTNSGDSDQADSDRTPAAEVPQNTVVVDSNASPIPSPAAPEESNPVKPGQTSLTSKVEQASCLSSEPPGEHTNPEAGHESLPVSGSNPCPSSNSSPPKVASPCVRICHRDGGGYCTGCLRSVVEIMRWDQMPEVQKKQVLEHVAIRRARREKRE